MDCPTNGQHEIEKGFVEPFIVGFVGFLVGFADWSLQKTL